MCEESYLEQIRNFRKSEIKQEKSEINFNQNKSQKSVITIKDNKKTFNIHKQLASNHKEWININEKTIKDDIQTNVDNSGYNKETVTNFGNNTTVLKVNLIIMKLLQKTHRNTKIRITIKKKFYRGRKNAAMHEKETSKKIPRKFKIHHQIVKGYIIGDSILKHVQGFEISKLHGNCKTYVKSFSGAKLRDMQDYVKPTLPEKTQTKLLFML